MNKYYTFLLLLLISFSNCVADKYWSQPVYGYETPALLVDGANVYAGTYGGGVMVSSNGGANWLSINTGLGNKSVNCLAIAATYLYAGTDAGVYYTSNSGASWKYVSNGIQNLKVFSLTVHSTRIYAGTEAGVYYSDNYGLNWYAMNTGLSNLNVRSIASNSTKLFAGTASGLYICNIGSNFWMPSSNLSSMNIRSIFVTDTSAYAGSWNGGGVYYSSNNGSGWTAVNNGLSYPFINCLYGFENKVLAGTSGGVFITSDKGTNWAPINSGLVNPYVKSLAVQGSNMIAGTDAGIYLADSKKNLWAVTNNSGLANLNINCLLNVEDYIYAGTSGGVYASGNGGASWDPINSGLPAIEFKGLVVASNVIYAGSISGAFVTTNKGSSWSPINTGLTNTQIRGMAFNGTNLFAGTAAGVFITTNKGVNWSVVNSGLSNTNIKCLISDGTTIYAGTAGGGVFVTTNNGTLWKPVNTGLTDLNINCISITGSLIYVGTNYGVFVTSNSGVSWTSISKNIFPIITCLYTDGDYVFAGHNNSGTGVGMLYTNNRGLTWISKGDGLENNDLLNCIDLSGNNLLVGTTGTSGVGVGLYSHTGASPGVPLQIAPLDLAFKVPVNTTLSWNTSVNATTYRLQVSTSNSFSDLIFDSENTTTSRNITGLELNKNYYWRVQAIDYYLKSAWSDIRSFTTVAPEMKPPVLKTPEDLSTALTISPTLTWEQVTDATQYRVDIALDSGFTKLVFDSVAVTTQITANTIKYNTKYFWRVKAYSVNDSSQWSTIWSFTTKTEPLTAIILTAPLDAAQNIVLNTKLEWKQSTNAINYRVQLSTSSTFNTFVTNSLETNLYKNLTNLLYKTKYFWRVKAYSATDSTDWSAIWSFTTKSAPIPQVILTAPLDSAVNMALNPKLEWKSSTGALSYRLQVSDNADFATYFENSLGASLFKNIIGLSYKTKYYWRVKAYSASDSSDWSSVWSFTTKSDAPGSFTLLAPVNDSILTGYSAILVWNPATNVKNYRIQIAGIKDFSILKDEKITTETSYEISGLSYKHAYYWRVKAYSGTDSSDWTEIWKFSTPGDIGVDDEYEAINSFIIAPNPAVNAINVNLNIEISPNAKMAIYDNLGNIVLPISLAADKSLNLNINVSTLTSGIYSLVLTNNGKTKASKFSITR